MEKKDAKILIADDSLFMRTIIRQILTDDGYRNFIECEDGQLCLTAYESQSPDLIILDLIMPVMNGVEVLRQIGAQANVMIISAMGQDQMIDDARKYGAKEYLTKPFLKETVTQKVNALINGMAVT